MTLTKEWAAYRKLPDHRALAVAGILQQNRWVAGASGGHETSASAKDAALRECRERRVRLRTPSECRIYAVGDEIVWGGP